MMSDTQAPERLDAANCSLLVDCTEDEQTFTARKPHNKLRVWKGRDFWHKQLDVQVRLEPDGRIYLSTQEGHVSTLQSATITIEQFHALIRGVTANDRSVPTPPEVGIEKHNTTTAGGGRDY